MKCKRKSAKRKTPLIQQHAALLFNHARQITMLNNQLVGLQTIVTTLQVSERHVRDLSVATARIEQNVSRAAVRALYDALLLYMDEKDIEVD